jgi:hypothetical protein
MAKIEFIGSYKGGGGYIIPDDKPHILRMILILEKGEELFVDSDGAIHIERGAIIVKKATVGGWGDTAVHIPSKSTPAGYFSGNDFFYMAQKMFKITGHPEFPLEGLADRRRAAEAERRVAEERAEAKRRFDKYWEENKAYKAELEAEKKSLQEQTWELGKQIAVPNGEIAALQKELDNEIATVTPDKFEGHVEMVNLQQNAQALIEQKQTLGLFKGKEKKAIQAQIDQINREVERIWAGIQAAMQPQIADLRREKWVHIAPLQASVQELQALNSPLQGRIAEIDNELTRPR